MAGDWKFSPGVDVTRETTDAARRGLLLAAEHVLTEANERVPIEEGTLARSGRASVDDGELKAAVSYDTPYAVRQHEDMTLRHDQGRQAKFLERAVASEVEAIRGIVADAIRGAL